VVTGATASSSGSMRVAARADCGRARGGGLPAVASPPADGMRFSPLSSARPVSGRVGRAAGNAGAVVVVTGGGCAASRLPMSPPPAMRSARPLDRLTGGMAS
jgi:hypothetical protein